MLFGGNSGSCGGCGCKSCQECTRTCTEPHTGTAFETVYTLYFEGAEAGNPTDGYLDATGDVDTSDPYDGMDGAGPWSQTVSGTFTLTKSTTRYPCYVRVSFWRSNFVLGANTVPPPATTLTEERITVTNSVLSEGAIIAGGFSLQPGESHQFDMAIPVAAGAGDQSTNDPRSYSGTVSVTAACANDYVSFTVTAAIEWNVQKRQHVLYGLVRECYEDPENLPCATYCDGSPAKDVLYLTISNYTGPTLSGAGVEGTYVLERDAGFCDLYHGTIPSGCAPYGSIENLTDGTVAWISESDILAALWSVVDGECVPVTLWISTSYNDTALQSACEEGILGSNTNGVVLMGAGGLFSPGPDDIVPGSFDWELST